MLQSIKVNNEVIELLQFLWQTVAAGNKVDDGFILDILEKPAMKPVYTEDFTINSARAALSALVNKEPLNNASSKDEAFYKGNFFNADDPGNVEMLLPVVKQLNLDDFKEIFDGQTAYDNIQINFVGAYDFDSMITDNVLTLNFFKLGVDWADMDTVLMAGKPLKDYIQQEVSKILGK